MSEANQITLRRMAAEDLLAVHELWNSSCFQKTRGRWQVLNPS